jgi:hypothetical protein
MTPPALQARSFQSLRAGKQNIILEVNVQVQITFEFIEAAH